MKKRALSLLAVGSAALVPVSGLSVTGLSASASEGTPSPVSTAAPARGEAALNFSPGLTAAMFKAGIFFYGESNVQVHMGDSGALAPIFSLSKGSSAGWLKRKISVEPRSGAVLFFNGPAEATAALDSLVIRQKGKVGTIHARLLGGQSSKKNVLMYRLAKVRIKSTSTGWEMNAQMRISNQGADILNNLLKTMIFKGGERVGTFSSSFSDSTVTAGGLATCDLATLRPDVEALVASMKGNHNLYSIDRIECANGWAAVFPTVGDTLEYADEINQVFRAQGQSWIPVSRDVVCGTWDPDNQTAYPADAQVPKKIWQDACNTN